MENETSASAIVNCTVLDIKEVRKGRLIALASVEIDVDGIVFVLDGVRIFRYRAVGNVQDLAGVSAPQYRDERGVWQSAVQLPPEIEAVFSDAVMRRCNELGVTDVKRTVGAFGKSTPSSIWQPN